MYYAHFSDFVHAYVGPFETLSQCEEHAEFCKARGDCAKYHGAVTALPEDPFVLTPQEDRDYDVNKEQGS